MGLKTAGVGHFTIPTAPAAGTSCTSGAANAFTGTYVVLSASTPSALFITGIHLESSAALAATYIVVQLATGGAGSESIVGQYLVPLSTASTVALGYRQIYPPILVANGTRVACKTADSVGAKATLVTLECIAQANVVDDGVAVATVTTLTNLPAITSNWLTAAGIAAGALNGKGDWMVSYTQPTGFLTATFPATVASTTNITAGTMTTVTNVTNAPTAGDFTATMKTSIGTAVAASAVASVTGNVGGNVTGSVGSVVGAVGSVTGAVGSVTGNVGGNVVGSVASVTAAVTLPTIPANWITAAGINASALNGKGDWLLSSGYTAPDNTSITAIKAKTDALTFTVAGFIDANILKVGGLAITGLGTEASPWRA